jgi:hypothetical protein
MSKVLEFLGSYLLGHLLDAVLSGVVKVTQAQSDAITKRQQTLIGEGHSQACAGAMAADEAGLLDGNLGNVIKGGGGCAKCRL